MPETLKSLMEFTELGSGFKIALHDLQIRGRVTFWAGQSGQLAEVGYELYLELLEQAIRSSRERHGRGTARSGDPPAVAAYLPEDYVPDIQQRLALYRRLSDRLSPEMVQDLEESCWTASGRCPGRAEPAGGGAGQAATARLGIKRLELHDSFAVLQFARRSFSASTTCSASSRSARRASASPGPALRSASGGGTPFGGCKLLERSGNFC